MEADINIALLLITFLLSLGALVWSFRIHGMVGETARYIRRAVIHQHELAQLLETHEQLADYQEKTQSYIDSGTATVRSLHREIANIPFEILESIPSTREHTRVVRGMHDLTADGVYASISSLNKVLGERMRQRMKLDQVRKNGSQGDDEPE